jgi:hypothetical protein
VYTGLSWTLSPRKSAEAKPNLSQLYRLSSAKPAKVNFFKAPASVLAALATEPYAVFVLYFSFYGVADSCRGIIRLWRVQSTVHPLSHTYTISLSPPRTLPPPPPPSADYSQPQFWYCNFLRRIAFILASNFLFVYIPYYCESSINIILLFICE